MYDSHPRLLKLTDLSIKQNERFFVLLSQFPL